MDALKQDYELITEFWKFVKAHQPEDTEAYWAKLVDDCNTWHKQHPSEFAGDLVLAWLKETERRALQQRRQT